MNHAEISKALAIALGYAPESVCIDTDKQGKYEPVCRVYRISYDMGPYWRWFDYRHPDVTLPLIEWLMREHDVTAWHGFGKGYVVDVDDEWVEGDTLAEAVARACIAVTGGG